MVDSSGLTWAVHDFGHLRAGAKGRAWENLIDSKAAIKLAKSGLILVQGDGMLRTRRYRSRTQIDILSRTSAGVLLTIATDVDTHTNTLILRTLYPPRGHHIGPLMWAAANVTTDDLAPRGDEVTIGDVLKANLVKGGVV